MPFKSDAQRKLMFAKNPEIAKRWVNEAKNKGVSVTKPIEKVNPPGMAVRAQTPAGPKVGFRKRNGEDLGVLKPNPTDGMKNLAVQAIKQRARRR